MSFIYALVSSDTIWYVGSTKNIKARLAYHRGKYSKGIGSDLIPDSIHWDLVVLEKVDIINRYDAERFYCDFLMPKINKNVPGRTRKERNRQSDKKKESDKKYYEKHKEQILQRHKNYNKIYYINNRERLIQKQREWRSEQNKRKETSVPSVECPSACSDFPTVIIEL